MPSGGLSGHQPRHKLICSVTSGLFAQVVLALYHTRVSAGARVAVSTPVVKGCRAFCMCVYRSVLRCSIAEGTVGFLGRLVLPGTTPQCPLGRILPLSSGDSAWLPRIRAMLLAKWRVVSLSCL